VVAPEGNAGGGEGHNARPARGTTTMQATAIIAIASPQTNLA